MYKVLKHKTLPDTYGVFQQTEEGCEICHCAMPNLHPETCTMNLLKYAYLNNPAFKQLDDYDLVTVYMTSTPPLDPLTIMEFSLLREAMYAVRTTDAPSAFQAKPFFKDDENFDRVVEKLRNLLTYKPGI